MSDKLNKAKDRTHKRWCSKHQCVHGEDVDYWSCRYPNDPERNRAKAEGGGMKYIGIFHTWFVSSKGFEVKLLNVDNMKDARRECVLIKHDMEDDFRHVAFTVLPIENDENIAVRKLSLVERITGVLRL